MQKLRAEIVFGQKLRGKLFKLFLMQIFVKNLSGETIVLQISEGSSVLDLKNQLA